MGVIGAGASATKAHVTGHLSFLAKTLFVQPVNGVTDWAANAAVSLIFVGLVGTAADTAVRMVTTESGTYENGGFSIGGAIVSDTPAAEHFQNSVTAGAEDVMTVYIGAGKALGSVVVGAINAFSEGDSGGKDKQPDKKEDKKFRFGSTSILPDATIPGKKNTDSATFASLGKQDKRSHMAAVNKMKPNTKAQNRSFKAGNRARAFA